MEQISETVRQAAIGMVAWRDALVRVTAATGGREGQVALFGDSARPLGHMVTIDDPELLARFAAMNGLDPGHNPRTRALLDARAGGCIVDAAFIDDAGRDASPIYRDLFVPADVEHCALLRTDPGGGMTAGLALLRGRTRGAMDAAERRRVEAIGPALADALRTAVHIETIHNRRLLDSTEQLAGAAFLLGMGMALLSCSPAAERLLRDARHLRVRGGRLGAPCPHADAALERAVAAATDTRGGEGPVTVTLRSPRGGDAPLVLEACRLPRAADGVFALAQVLIVARRPPPLAPRAEAIAALFDLSAAETQVALLLAAGTDPAGIARRRGVAIGTVRAQLKSLFAKTATHRQAELVARLRSCA
jgi:DNA-binding CsgD family transcriptional regulator